MANKSYINPKTGQPCDYNEYTKACASSSTTSTATPTIEAYTEPTLTEGVGPGGLTYEEYLAQAPEGTSEADVQAHWLTMVGGPQGPTRPGAMGATQGQPSTTTTTPTFGEGAGADIPTPEVTPAPPYEKTPEQIAFEEMYGGKLTDWVEAGGYGIPEETQAQMIQQQTDALKAREQESIRVMTNNMERRGLTNTGLLYANTQAIKSNTSKAIAGAIADVQIKSSLMKLASFETAMGQAGQFLNYLSTQSQLAYQPQFATWQAEQLAKMQAWQGKLDLLKMEINQAYQTQNLQLQSQLQGQLNAQQHQYDIELAEMEIEAAQQAAKAEAGGSISGSIVTGLFAVGAAFLGV